MNIVEHCPRRCRCFDCIEDGMDESASHRKVGHPLSLACRARAEKPTIGKNE